MSESVKRELRGLAADLRSHAASGVDLEHVALYVAGRLDALAEAEEGMEEAALEAGAFLVAMRGVSER